MQDDAFAENKLKQMVSYVFHHNREKQVRY